MNRLKWIINVAASSGWVNAPIAAQNGQFTATFDASASPTDGLIGFAQGVVKDYTQVAPNPSGRIDARNFAFRSAPGAVQIMSTIDSFITGSAGSIAVDALPIAKGTPTHFRTQPFTF